MTRIGALIFDFDGTLLDTETPEYHAWQEIYREHGASLTLAEWLEGVGTWYAFDPYADLERKLGRPLDRAAIQARLKVLHHDVLLEMALRDGVEGLVREARRRGLKLAVASSSDHRWVDAHLARYGLLEAFDAILCRDDVPPGRSKPHPDLYLAALDALGVPAREAIAFEDSLNGVRAAKTAGLFVVAVANAVTQHLPLDEADLVVHSFEEVDLDRLQMLFARGG
ncbi:MAG: HAD family hydrolase [Anaerolineae bacterium]|nr:HAD family hydrolase [Candidatus Roseilinea sp.]MDW8450981.1 HAD family hydrolase [Anaerolineae bacterium]